MKESELGPKRKKGIRNNKPRDDVSLSILRLSVVTICSPKRFSCLNCHCSTGVVLRSRNESRTGIDPRDLTSVGETTG